MNHQMLPKEGIPPDRSERDDDAPPDWCNVYAGLSDNEIAELEKIILTRADLTRCSVLEPTVESTSHASPPA